MTTGRPVIVDFVYKTDRLTIVWSGIDLDRGEFIGEFMPGMKRHLGMNAVFFENPQKGVWDLMAASITNYGKTQEEVRAGIEEFLAEYFGGEGRAMEFSVRDARPQKPGLAL